MAPEQKRRTKRRAITSVATVHQNGTRIRQLPLPPPFALASGDAPEGIAPVRLMTIGHSNHEVEHFLELLRQHGVQTLVDVRSAPYSRYAPHFSRNPLATLLGGARVAYQWAGDTLGGRPADPACYRDGQVLPRNLDYDAVASQPWYQAGLQELLALAGWSITVIMCSEEDPRRCHRHSLIERSLRELHVDVLHIRRDGSLERIGPDEDAMPEAPSPQLALIGFNA